MSDLSVVLRDSRLKFTGGFGGPYSAFPIEASFSWPIEVLQNFLK